MYKKIAGLLFLAVFLLVPIWYLRSAGPEQVRRAIEENADISAVLETSLAQNLPESDWLRQMRVTLSYLSGNREQNGIFIADGALMLDVQPRSLNVSNNNMLSFIDFAEAYHRPTYVMLIPTACAILQSKVPYAEVAPLYDQRMLIDDIYRRISGHVTAIDVYPTLFNHQNEYIYYNTDNSPTGLGGYYIYTAAVPKLGISRASGLDEFEVEHLDYSYYGDLYQISPYSQVKADRISAYRYSKFWRSYTMTHYDQSGAKRYYTLYPTFKKELGSSMDVLLGGASPVIDITVRNPQYSQYSQRLLIFGDRTALSYLPFLLVHYEQITLVDTSSVTTEQLEWIDPADYNQVLFSYSVDRFVLQDQTRTLNSLIEMSDE